MNIAAAKEKSVARTLAELLEDLISDEHPGPDGCANTDRIVFIMEVLGCEEININQTYNFTPVVRSKNPHLVEASLHIAYLQLDYLKRAYDNEHMDDETYDLHKARLLLDLNKMRWHYDHLIAGNPTPPFPFIH